MLLNLTLVSFAIFVALFFDRCQATTITVSTKSGQVRGKLIQLSPSFEVYEFAGIPFAEPPVGEKRFRKPTPKQPWSDVLDAMENPKACQQVIPDKTDVKDIPSFFSLMMPTSTASEDCLYLNLWVPKATVEATVSNNRGQKSLSLLTFIHGGGFNSGAVSGTWNNGSVLAGQNNIIVASVQYRLGSLGFGYMGTEEMPGNMGLWDQLEALKWLCENIDSFGGNCSDHTIFGESAGSISVTYHLLSPYSRRYFSRAIAQSGTAQARFTYRMPDKIISDTNKLFLTMKNGSCSSLNQEASTADKIDCLRSVPANSFPMTDYLIGLTSGFYPVVDGDFVPRNPNEMLRSGDYYQAPLMAGFNKNEGSIFFRFNPKSAGYLSRIYELNYTDYSDIIDIMFEEPVGGMDTPDPLAVEAVKLAYWPKCKNEPCFKGYNVYNAVEAGVGEAFISCPTLEWLKQSSKPAYLGSKIYGYYFSEPLQFTHEAPWLGTFHSSELLYIFGMPLFPQSSIKFSRSDLALSRIMMRYWTNFAKYGDPNVKDADCPSFGMMPLYLRHWPPFRGEICEEQIVNLNSMAQYYQRGPAVTCSFKARECEFWNSFFPKLNDRLANDVETGETNY